MSDRLQAKEDLTLEMADQMSRQAEAQKQNKDLIRGSAISEMDKNPTRVDLVEPNLVPMVYSAFKMAAERRPWHTPLHPPRSTPRIVEYFVT